MMSLSRAEDVAPYIDRSTVQADLVALCRALEPDFRLAEQRAGGRCVVLAEMPLSPASAVILSDADLARPPFARIPLETSVLRVARAALGHYQPGAEIPIIVYVNGPPRVVLPAIVRRRAAPGGAT